MHEGRYRVAAVTADEHVHSYLSWTGPLICGFVVLAVAEFAFRLTRRHAPSGVPHVPRLGTRWAAFAALLVAIFATQELVEMLVVHGHVDVAESLLHHGGWLAAPLAVFVGGLVALLLRGAAALLARAARVRGRVPRAQRGARRPATEAASPRWNVLARNLAGRAPPPSFVS